MKKKILVISVIILLVDQLLKQLIINNLSYLEEVNIISNFLYITYVKNTGGAFSILENNTYLLIIIGLLCIGAIVYYLIKKDNFRKLEIICYPILIGGILGNFMDRIFYKSVIDYIGIILGNYYFPIFNFADICIVVSVIMILFDELVGEKNGNRSIKR